jgi:predicted DCC family thiol-disulfide oxidoreductase YuxK
LIFVNATIPNCKHRGEIFYDADCGLCSRGATRWGGLFERRGFHWLPLQTPGTTERLSADTTEVQAEMKLLLADGRIVGGAEAWAVLLRAVWWLWPIGVLMGLPGIKIFGDLYYRWLARNRHYLSTECGLQKCASTHRRHSAFFDLP